MARASVTIKDVAREARVSVATVSGVLNNNPSFSARTRERVLQVAGRLKYVPDAAAVGLVTGRRSRSVRRGTFGVMIADTVPDGFSNPSVSRILNGVLQRCAAVNATVVTGVVRAAYRPTADMPVSVRRGDLDGIIVIGGVPSLFIRQLCDANIPVVRAESSGDELRVDTVNVDNRRAAFDATTHLADLGHRYIGVLCDAPVGSVYPSERLEGYRSALAQRGLPVRSRYIRAAGADFREGYRSMQQLLRDCPEVTAVFAMNDLLALGAIQAARENGRRVSHDISIVGYDDIPMAAMALPSLTTIHPPLEQVGAQALQLLEKRVTGGSGPAASVFLASHVVARESSGPCRGG